MELSTILLALPIFFLVYQGIGLLMESRSQNKWNSTWQPPAPPSQKSGIREFTALSAKLGFNRAILRYGPLNRRLDLLLLRSGHPFGWKEIDFLLVKEIGAVLALFVVWYSGNAEPIAYLLAPVLGFWLPDFYIKAKGTARQSQIQRSLPGFVDLSALALESGLDLMSAIERIIEKMRPSGLREELYTLLQENRLGTPRKEALENLAYRVNLPDVQSMTSIIIQSEELGTSLVTVLRSYAEDMRNKRILRAEELAGKMPVKLLFPMMVFFFPIVFVIIFGPLGLQFLAGNK